jgi:hypothetical protein
LSLFNEVQNSFNEPLNSFNEYLSLFNEVQNSFNEAWNSFNEYLSFINEVQNSFNEPLSLFNEAWNSFNEPLSFFNEVRMISYSWVYLCRNRNNPLPCTLAPLLPCGFNDTPLPEHDINRTRIKKGGKTHLDVLLSRKRKLIYGYLTT